MISIVLGSFMGDEGKGQTVHNICAKNPENSLVIRFLVVDIKLAYC